MRKIIKKQYYDYLENHLSKERNDTWEKLSKKIDTEVVFIEIEFEAADEIRDWAI